jgi:hypothetical protein
VRKSPKSERNVFNSRLRNCITGFVQISGTMGDVARELTSAAEIRKVALVLLPPLPGGTLIFRAAGTVRPHSGSSRQALVKWTLGASRWDCEIDENVRRQRRSVRLTP